MFRSIHSALFGTDAKAVQALHHIFCFVFIAFFSAKFHSIVSEDNLRSQHGKIAVNFLFQTPSFGLNWRLLLFATSVTQSTSGTHPDCSFAA